ncbi:MAG: hypothetical protein AB1665_05090 [Candidatus Thermoplasmatota archaeon]
MFSPASERILRILHTLWASVIGAVIVAFLFVSVQLEIVATFSFGDTALFVGPLMCGFIIGLLLSSYEIQYAIGSSVILTSFSALLVTLAHLAPGIWGGSFIVPTFYIHVAQQVMVMAIFTFPLSIVGSVLGKISGESTILTETKRERERLLEETREWYRMLEQVETLDKLKFQAPALSEAQDENASR